MTDVAENSAIAALFDTVDKGTDSDAFPRSAAYNAAQRRIKEAIRIAKPGDMIEGAGIFIGTWTPRDRDGNWLQKTFNVFAAPTDLPDEKGETYHEKFDQAVTFHYDEALARVGTLQQWHGFDGTLYATDSELVEALRNDTYNGGWIIPPLELLIGFDKDGDSVDEQPNLLALKDEGALGGSFNVDQHDNISCTSWYWSCTKTNNGHGLWCADLRASDLQTNSEDFVYLNCRPIRLQPVEM